jgi:hypothetical protein
MFIVGFNGPPQSGKDTAALMLSEALDSRTNLPVKVVSVVDTLARMGAVLLGVTYSDEWYHEAKPQKFELLGGQTLREWMIDQTENFYKPRYGNDFWFRALLENHRYFHGVLIVTNIGFQYESELARMNSDGFMLTKVNRTGCDFANDSRGPVKNRQYRVIHNDSTLDNLANQMDVYAEILKDMWSL